MKVLLIDDEIVALNALKKRVDWVKYGFTEVHAAQEAATAREMLKKYKFDLIISDIEMPGEDGLSLIEHVKEVYPAVDYIFVTCHANFSYIKKAMKFKSWDYILKPIDYEELDTLLTQYAAYKENTQNKAEINTIIHQTQEQRTEVTAPAEERLETVKKYIKDNLREQIYVEELANLVHVNERHLMRIFKKETGQSILEYITQQRITVSSNLLKETDYTINFIADCVGCDNYSYFTKLFKRYTGFTPSEYRAQFKK